MGWLVPIGAAAVCLYFTVKNLGPYDSSMLKGLADALFGPSQWKVEPQAKAFGTAVFTAVHGGIDGRTVLLQYFKDTSSGSTSARWDHVLAFLPCRVQSTTTIMPKDWTDSLAKLLPREELPHALEPASFGLARLSVRTERMDHGSALLSNPKLNEALRALAQCPRFETLRVACAEKTSGILDSSSVCAGKSGMLLTLYVPRGELGKEQDEFARLIRLLAAAAGSFV